MKRRRVKITGIGPVTPAGIGREAFWSGILEPVSRVRPYAKLGDEHGPMVAAFVDKFNPANYVERTLPSGLARHTAFAVVGAKLALDDAGISLRALPEMHSVVVTGSGYMDFGGISNAIDAVRKDGHGAAHRRAPYTMDIGGVPSAVNNALEIGARTMAFSTQCVAGMDAIGHAAELVATGEVEIAICGGTDAPLHRFPLLELRAAGLTPMTEEMPGRLARPFDRWRTTGVISEGACMFVLEPESSERPGYSYVSGYAYANDTAHDLCGGMEEATLHALAEARLRPSDVESISAWGPGHKFVDRNEAQIMIRIFGAGLAEIPTASIKGSVGSPVGAAPAIQVATAALGQRHGMITPTVNWEYPDPSCPLNLSNRARSIDHRNTLINGHGIGGLNSSLVLTRC